MPGALSKSILGAAYLAPLRNFGAVIRIFWPVLLFATIAMVEIFHSSNILLSGLLASSEGIPKGPPGGFLVYLFLGVSLSIYTAFLLASGLVRWHRMIVLQEPAQRLAFVPQARDRTYLWRWFIIGLLTILFYFAVALPLLPFVLPYFQAASVSADQFPAGDLSLIRRMQLPTLILNVFITGFGGLLAAVLLARNFLFLPIVSVESSEFVAIAKTNWAPLKDRGFTIGILVATLPLILLPDIASYFYLENFVFPLMGPNADSAEINDTMRVTANIARDLASMALYFYAILVFASYLSLYYREHIRPTFTASFDTKPARSEWAD